MIINISLNQNTEKSTWGLGQNKKKNTTYKSNSDANTDIGLLVCIRLLSIILYLSSIKTVAVLTL